MNMRDIVNRNHKKLITISEYESLQTASEKLEKHKIGVLLVTNLKGKPLGILSERDIVYQIARKGSEALDLQVKEAMIGDLIVGGLDEEINCVMAAMTDYRIRHLPIIEDAEPVGLVSMRDLVAALVGEIDEIESDCLQKSNIATLSNFTSLPRT